MEKEVVENSGKKMTPLLAIKIHCKECSGDEMSKNCIITDCVLYRFRLGFDMEKKGKVMSEENKQRLREQMAKVRDCKKS